MTTPTKAVMKRKPVASRVAPAPQKCRICGCMSEDCRACIALTGERCFWSEPDLCSACVGITGDAAIAKEFLRGRLSEGWSPAHDDGHRGFELTRAAVSYLATVTYPDEIAPDNPVPCDDWPWGLSWWKPAPTKLRNLIKAGALIAAEVDRLLRLEDPPADSFLFVRRSPKKRKGRK